MKPPKPRHGKGRSYDAVKRSAIVARQGPAPVTYIGVPTEAINIACLHCQAEYQIAIPPNIAATWNHLFDIGWRVWARCPTCAGK